MRLHKLPNDVIVIAATNRMDLLDAAFVSRCPVRAEFMPFTIQEKRAMVEKFLSSVNMSISEQEMNAITKNLSQRDIINSVIQYIAAQLAGKADGS